MIVKLYSLVLILLLSLSTGCNDEFATDADPSSSGVIFSISTLSSQIDEIEQTRSLPDEPISSMWYAIFDKSGQSIHPAHQLLKPDFSQIIVEGLRDGEYSIAILATSSKNPHDVEALNTAADVWLQNPNADKPINGDYFYKRSFFVVESSKVQQDIQIQLGHAVGQVMVDIVPFNIYSMRFIRKVEFSLSDGSGVYQSQLGDGAYSGNASIKMLDITQDLAFFSLPGQGKLAGSVKVTSVLGDDKTIVTSTHRFSEFEIAPGKLSYVRIDYTHPEDQRGNFRVTAEDYTKDNSTLILQDDEPRNVFTNHSLRNFRVNRPLKVSINGNKELQLQFYSGVPIHNVKIMCKFLRHSSEYFELAHYDVIPAFHESRMPIPITQRSCTFRTADGRNVVIPAMPNLSDNDCLLEIRTDDPYMAKIATIDPQWHIRFSDYSAEPDNSNNWRFMNPYLCREACVLSVNMAFLFSHPDFETELLLWEDKLKDNANNIIPLQTIRDRILSQRGLVMGHCGGGVAGLGGGETYGLADYVYREIYFDANDDVFTFAREVPFHEFGHCMGYGHSSNMTYGDAWTRLCTKVYIALGRAGSLPVSSKTWVDYNTPRNSERLLSQK